MQRVKRSKTHVKRWERIKCKGPEEASAAGQS